MENALRIKSESATLVYDFESMHLAVMTNDSELIARTVAILPHLEQCDD